MERTPSSTAKGLNDIILQSLVPNSCNVGNFFLIVIASRISALDFVYEPTSLSRHLTVRAVCV